MKILALIFSISVLMLTSSNGFAGAAGCITTNGNTICGATSGGTDMYGYRPPVNAYHGSSSGYYNPNTGRSAVAHTNQNGVTRAYGSNGGRAIRGPAGYGAAQGPGGHTCARTRNGSGCN